MKWDIEFLEIRHLNGPNMWTYRPVLEAIVDIHDLEDYPSNTIPGFVDRLVAWVPTLIEHRCSYDEHGGFVRRLREGTWPAHILEHVTLELQNLAGMPGGFGRARDGIRRGVYRVVVRAWQEDVTREALHSARDLILSAMQSPDEPEYTPYDVAAAIERLRDLADREFLGPSTASIVEAAEDRQIPAIRLSEGNLVQLGYGKASRRIWTAETDLTGAIAETISRDKELTKSLLGSCGLPVPEGYPVDGAAQAWSQAQSLGLPVVIKPNDSNRGRGVFIGLSTEDEVKRAYEIAVSKGRGSGVLVERLIPGLEHRLLVVGNRMVAATRGETISVIADGTSTVVELIEAQLNSDPRRGDTEDYPLSRIEVNSALRMELSRQGLHEDSIPAAGRSVLIQRNGNHAIDVTDQVHPQTAQMATLAARIIGLDIAGIDVVAEDIARPLAEQRGAIVEVNAGPGLLMHLKPAQGQPRPVGRAIVDHLFPADTTGRIPIIGITGTSATTQTAMLVAHLLSLSGRMVGMSCANGVSYDRRFLKKTNPSHWKSARQILLHRAVEAAVIESDMRTIAAEGLAYDRCHIGVMTSFSGSKPLTDLGIPDEEEQIFRVLRTQIDVVLSGGYSILNADDEKAVEMSSLSDGQVIFFSTQPDNPIVKDHLFQGGTAVLLRDNEIVIHAKGESRSVSGYDMALFEGAGAFASVESVLAAVAVAHAMQLSDELIVAGLQTFTQRPAPVEI